MDKGSMIRSVVRNLERFTDDYGDRKKIEDIVDAIETIDRKHFLQDDPYIDNAMPIGYGQTISQPSTVARMLQLADLDSGIDVLEIGSGSGWNASLISYIVKPGRVVSIDNVPELIRRARKSVKAVEAKIGDIRFIDNDATAEPDALEKELGRFARIIFTAGIDDQQEMKIEELAWKLLHDGGILLCPYRNGPIMVIRKKKEELEKEYTKEHYMFVPLRAGQ